MNLRFDLLPFPRLAHVSRVNFVIEVSDVAHQRTFFQARQDRAVTNVHVTCGGDQYVGILEQAAVEVFNPASSDAVLVWRYNFETVHAGLHGTDRIDLGDANDHAFLAQRLC